MNKNKTNVEKVRERNKKYTHTFFLFILFKGEAIFSKCNFSIKNDHFFIEFTNKTEHKDQKSQHNFIYISTFLLDKKRGRRRRTLSNE